MSHTTSIAHGHKIREARVGKIEEAVTHIPPGSGRRSLWVLGELLTYKLPGHRTGGAYSLFEATAKPGAGPPPHVHHREDEAFYVLEGEYEFLVDGHTFMAGAGSLIYVPKGTLHAHRNVGEGLGSMLLTQTPGGLYELFFEKAGRSADGDHGGPPLDDGWPATGRRIVEVAAEHGIEIPSPIAR